MRLATIVTPSGPRLHVRGRSGYVDVAEETGDPEFASLAAVLARARRPWTPSAALPDRDGPRVRPGGPRARRARRRSGSSASA